MKPKRRTRQLNFHSANNTGKHELTVHLDGFDIQWLDKAGVWRSAGQRSTLNASRRRAEELKHRGNVRIRQFYHGVQIIDHFTS